MERIQHYDALSQLVSAHLTRGVCANTAVSRARFQPLLTAGALYALDTPQALLLLAERESHHRLYFFLHDLDSPLPLETLPRPLVTEIPFRPRDVQLQRCAAWLEAQGMRQVLTRLRFARAAERTGPFPHGVTPAVPADRARVDALLKENYSLLTGCLLNAPELEEALSQGRFLLLEEGGRLLALLHYTLEEKHSEMRHLAVRRERRGQGLAKTLITAYLADTAGRKSLVWTGEENLPAQRTFQSQGYAPDGWRSIVLCWD